MRWDAPTVAGFARRAGFTGDALVQAVAVALSTSGGDDAWQWRPNDGSAYDLRGLFGINVALYPRFRDRTLYNAQISADTANELWLESPSRWEWAINFGHLAYLLQLPTAIAAVTNATLHQTLDQVPQMFGLPGINGPRLTTLQRHVATLAQTKHALTLIG